MHGSITASKFLFLGESVRDVVDLKLSSKFMAPANILGKNWNVLFIQNIDNI